MSDPSTFAFDDYVLSLGPVGWWKLADFSGSLLAADSSGNGYAGSVEGGLVFDQVGPIAGAPSETAASVNGTTGYVTVAHQSAFDLTTNFTLACFVKTSNTSTDPCVLYHSGYWTLRIEPSGQVFVADTAGNSAQLNSPAPLVNDGRWHLLVATMGNTASFSDLSIYIDGVKYTATIAGTWNPSLATNQPLAIGSSGGGQYYFNGDLAQAMVFDTALTSTQVAMLWAYAAVEQQLQMPVVRVEMSPTAMFGTPNWQDISQYVLSGTTNAGRQHELDRVESSTLSLELDNRGGQFNRFDTSSPLYFSGSGLVPGNPIRVTATWSGTTYAIYYGFIQSVDDSTLDAVNATATIKATDLFQFLALHPLSDPTGYPTLIEQSNPVAFWRFNDDPPYNTSSAQALQYGSGPAIVVNGLTAGRQSFGQAGPIYVDPATACNFASNTVSAQIPPGLVAACNNSASGWTLEFWIDGLTSTSTFSIGPAASVPSAMNYIALAVGSVSYHAFSPGQIGVVGYVSTAFSGPSSAAGVLDDGLPHMIHMTINESSSLMLLYVDGASVGSVPISNTFDYFPFDTTNVTYILGGSATLSNLALYNSPLSNATIASHYSTGAQFQSQMTTGELVQKVCSFSGMPSSQAALTTSGGMIEPGTIICQAAASDLTGTYALDRCTTAQQTEDGIFYIDPSGNAVFKDRYFPFKTYPAVTVSDNDTGVAYEADVFLGQDDLDLWTTVQVTPVNLPLQQAVNNTAASTYGQRLYNGLNNLLMTTTADALNLANWVLTKFDAPIMRASTVSLSSTSASGAAVPYMLGLYLWDQVTFVRSQAPGQVTTFTQPNVIEQIQHKWTPEEWRTTWALSPFELDVSLFVLGGQAATESYSSSSASVTATPGTFGMELPGFSVSGTNINAGSVVIRVSEDGSTLQLSLNPVGTGTNQVLTFTGNADLLDNGNVLG